MIDLRNLALELAFLLACDGLNQIHNPTEHRDDYIFWIELRAEWTFWRYTKSRHGQNVRALMSQLFLNTDCCEKCSCVEFIQTDFKICRNSCHCRAVSNMTIILQPAKGSASEVTDGSVGIPWIRSIEPGWAFPNWRSLKISRAASRPRSRHLKGWRGWWKDWTIRWLTYLNN